MVQDLAQNIKLLHKTLKQRPKDAGLHSLAATTYERLGRHADALPHFAFLLSNAPHPDEALYVRYVKALQATGDLPKALQMADLGLTRYPASFSLSNLKALTLTLNRQFEQACEFYTHLASNAASHPQASGMCGFLKLLKSDMKDGYDDYARRTLESANLRILGTIPRWSGEDLQGKRVFVWSEQGIGDVIMFLGLLPWILAQGALVSLILVPKLAPLVARSFPGIKVLTGIPATGIRQSDYDYHIPIGDLLTHVFRLYTPADHPPYFKADAARTGRLRTQYLAKSAEHGRTRLIGLSWHTMNPDVGFTRNITLSELHPVLSVPNVQYVSLQYGSHADEIADCNRRMRDIIHCDPSIDPFNDIDGLAAQMAAMDEVITIDNATLHLAGALGIETALLLPTVPDWRWGLTKTDCLWYRSVRLERQEALGKWHSVLKRIRTRLLNASSSAA